MLSDQQRSPVPEPQPAGIEHPLALLVSHGHLDEFAIRNAALIRPLPVSHGPGSQLMQYLQQTVSLNALMPSYSCITLAKLLRTSRDWPCDLAMHPIRAQDHD